MITYEYPLNERVRTLLRLEDLYDRASYFLGKDEAHDHHACLAAMFEILEVASRADLKSDLLQELDRQRTFLEALRSNPAISEEKLDGVVGEIDHAFATLHATSGKTGAEPARERVAHVHQAARPAFPAGTSEFDLPSYHHWLHHAGTAPPRRPRRRGCSRCCRCTRHSPSCCACCARAAAPSRSSPSRASTSRRRPRSRRRCCACRCGDDLACVPEISANKYALNVRFLLPEGVQKSRVYEHDVPFELAFCNL